MINELEKDYEELEDDYEEQKEEQRRKDKQEELIKSLFEDDLGDDYSNFNILKSKFEEQRKDIKRKPKKTSSNDEQVQEQETETNEGITVTEESACGCDFITQDELIEQAIADGEHLPDDQKFSFSSLEKIKKMSSIDRKLELEQATNEYLLANNLSVQKIRTIIESTLYVMGNDGMTISDLKHLLDLPNTVLGNIIAQMAREKDLDVNSGLCIKQFGNRFKILTKEETYDEICKVINKKEIKPLNKTKLEVLSIIAYTQPCTRKSIERIRGKDCTSILLSLLELGLVDRRQATDLPGRPKLYTVSHKFFDMFGIKSLTSLPKIERLNHESMEEMLNTTTEDYEDEEE